MAPAVPDPRVLSLDARLAPVDRWLWRWAASVGSGLPGSIAPDPALHSRVPPLNDDEAIVTDGIVTHAPYGWPSFLHTWYRTDKSTQQIAQKFGLNRSSALLEHQVVLGYVLGQLYALGVRLPRFPGVAVAGRLSV
ncbi:MAG: hypothetical protein ACRETH_01605 [Steroidobacteraceae bacterium]